jgi:hypothetical protein
MTRKFGPIILAAGIALAGVLSMVGFGQQSAKANPKSAALEVLPLTCAQAWVKAGKSYPQMISIVKTLARVSLANRDLTFPNTREAGTEAGKNIAEDCKADPDALLFAIVDKQVRRVAGGATGLSK